MPAQEHRLYLPLVAHAQPQPDLITSIRLQPQPPAQPGQPVVISVIVRNQGTAASRGFWVDLYMQPSVAPTHANQQWNSLCGLTPCYGMAWYVAGLEVGQSITLSSAQPQAGYVNWPGWFAPGTSMLYAYADSWNPGQEHGAVEESNEENNRAELAVN